MASFFKNSSLANITPKLILKESEYTGELSDAKSERKLRLPRY
jgi:hypothetical protein